MRTMTAQEARVAALLHRTEVAYLDVKDADGNWVNLSDLRGRDWVIDWTFEEDLDQQVGSLKATLWRNEYYLSLAGFVETSRLNRDALGAYAPLVAEGRSIRLRGAIIPADHAVASAEISPWWEGRIEDVDDATSEGTISLTAHDLGAFPRDTFIEEERIYGSAGGVAVETVAQSILTDNGTGITLYVPVSPGWNITPAYTQKQQGVLEALTVLFELRGWVVRYRWDSATSSFRLTAYEPPRSSTTSLWTFGAGTYLNLTGLGRSITDVRNAGRVRFRNSATGLRDATAVATDTASISKYGRRYFEIVEGDDSPINSVAEAEALRDAPLNDLKEPKVSAVIEVPLFPWVQLGDLYTVAADGERFSDDQKLAVVGFSHRYAKGSGRTTLRLRGSPAGAYRRWLRKIITPSATTMAYVVGADVAIDANAFTVTVQADLNAASLWYSEYVSGSWTADTQFASSREGTFTGTATVGDVRRFRVAAKNGAGMLGEYREIRVDGTALDGDNNLTTGVGAGVQASDGASFKNLVKAALGYSVRNGQVLVFPQAYQDTPPIIFAGGITGEERAKWGTQAQADANSGNGSGTDAKPSGVMFRQVFSADVTASGFTARLYLVAEGSPGAKSAGSADTLSGVGDTSSSATPASADVPDVAGQYSGAFEADITGGVPGQSGTLVVAIEYQDGGGVGPWTEVGTVSIGFTLDGSGEFNTAASVIGNISGVSGGNDNFRLKIKSCNRGTPALTLLSGWLTWTRDATAKYASATPAGASQSLQALVLTSS